MDASHKGLAWECPPLPPHTHTWSAGVALMTSSTCQAQPGTNDKASAMCASGDEAPAAASSALKQTNLWV